MNARASIRILSEFNKWRRGEPPYDALDKLEREVGE